MGSLHGATRFGMENEIGGLGGGRRADLVLLNDDLEPVKTPGMAASWWSRTQGDHPAARSCAVRHATPIPMPPSPTVKLPESITMTPELPAREMSHANVCASRTARHHALPRHRRPGTGNDWQDPFRRRHGLCFVTIIERHGKSDGNVAHGLLKDFGLKNGAVASSVGHDSHNIIIAGTNEADMQVALGAIKDHQGGVVTVKGGQVTAMVPLPIAGLLSDKRVTVVAEEMSTLKAVWKDMGCTIPFMGFNLIPLSVIPEIRITDKGMVRVPEMTLEPLYVGE
jgi:adenine deaminase